MLKEISLSHIKWITLLCLTTDTCVMVLAVGVKYWNKQGGKCLCEEQDKERLFSFLGILGSEWRSLALAILTPACSNTLPLPLVQDRKSYYSTPCDWLHWSPFFYLQYGSNYHYSPEISSLQSLASFSLAKNDVLGPSLVIAQQKVVKPKYAHQTYWEAPQHFPSSFSLRVQSRNENQILDMALLRKPTKSWPRVLDIPEIRIC